jgi:hypothetical protein
LNFILGLWPGLGFLRRNAGQLANRSPLGVLNRGERNCQFYRLVLTFHFVASAGVVLPAGCKLALRVFAVFSPGYGRLPIQVFIKM